MTNFEFNTWLSDFQVRFPDCKDWMGKHPATVKLWFEEVFQSLPLDDCLDANRQLFASDDPIRAYERETIAARVSKIARKLAYGRSEGGQQQQWMINHRRAATNRMQLSEGERGLSDELRELFRNREKTSTENG